MIELPWQIIVAFVALFGFNLLLQHLRHTSCEERVEAAKRQVQRDTMATYRAVYNTAREQGKNDA